MAFTIDEIEKAIHTSREEWPMYYPQDLDFTKSVNYQIVIDFLTGKTNALNHFVHDEYFHYWSTLVNLITDIENISAKEQLVIDLIRNPQLWPYMEHSFHHFLWWHAKKNSTGNTFKAIYAQFKISGLTDSEIFHSFIASISARDNVYTGIENAALKQFLIAHIKTWKTFSYNNNRQFGFWNNYWNYTLFYILEEANGDFAKEYLLDGIINYTDAPVQFFIEYDNNKYLDFVVSFLTNGDTSTIEILQEKFSFAIKMYQLDGTKYVSILSTIVHQYLNYCKQFKSKQTWEKSIHLNDTTVANLSYMPFSSYAFHFLLLENKTLAIELLSNWFENKIFVQVQTLQVFYFHLKEDALPFVEIGLKYDALIGGIDYYRSVISMLQDSFAPIKFLPLLWDLVSNKSKPLRILVAGIVAEKDVQAEQKAIVLLNHKSADARQTAALILSYFNTNTARQAVMNVLNTETNDNARDILLQTVADSLPKNADEAFIQNMVEAALQRGKLNKSIEAWIVENELPSLFYISGVALSINELRFLLYRTSRVKTMQSDAEAKLLIQKIDKNKAATFALHIIKLFVEKGAKPEHKYLMALAALLGNDEVVTKIRIIIDKWMEENRGKMAEYGVGALALQGSDKALRWVEWYSRKYKSKKANVGVAALLALETAAEELGITVHELGDRVVPDFGFDGLFKRFQVNGEEHRAFIDSNFKIAFFNEDDKKLKVIPAATDVSIKDDFKSITKEVRDIVKSQSSRLEYYLIIQRKWTYEQWQKFFLQNPVMFIYATKLLWGLYDGTGQLLNTFICNEDTSLLDDANEEIEIEANVVIGIVHPTQLDEAHLQKWKQLFFDSSIDQIFAQLDRKMPQLKDVDLDKNIINKYDGIKMKEGSIRSTLEKFGWHKGIAGDGGMLESFNLLYFEKQLEAVMQIEGVGAGYGWGGEEKLGKLYVIDKTKVTNKWDMYIRNEEDEKLVKLKDLPPVFLNEMIAAIESIKKFE